MGLERAQNFIGGRALERKGCLGACPVGPGKVRASAGRLRHEQRGPLLDRSGLSYLFCCFYSCGKCPYALVGCFLTVILLIQEMFLSTCYELSIA